MRGTASVMTFAFFLLALVPLCEAASLGFEVRSVRSLKEANGNYWDSLVFVSEDLKDWPEDAKEYRELIEKASKVDNLVNKSTNVFYPCGNIGYMVNSPVGPVNRDYDDVRSYQDATRHVFRRLLGARKKRPILVVPKSKTYHQALLVSLLSAYQQLYVPIELREVGRGAKIDTLGVLETHKDVDDIIKKSVAIEKGRIVTRDIAGSDPERMAAPRVAEYLQKEFRDTDIFMNVTSSQEEFKRNYPLIAAVNRAAYTVERHRARLINLEYTGEGEIDVTYFLVGKGITFDTGGADLKTGGSMKSMHRDKSGAATVAGFFKILSELKPKGIKVVGQLPMVRNSIGADSYLSDEIITSAAGVRVRIMNTDAEGRNVMVDPLHYAKLMAMKEKNPHIMTIATLTGSAVRYAGPAYSVVMENGVARNIGFAEKLQAAGEDVAEPFELSRLRREDYAFIRGRSEYEDVIQSSSRKSSSVFRGHQFPCAFMIRASGLDKHGISSKKPLKYTHLDIAGPAVFTYPGIPNARPLVALCKALKVF